MQKVLSAVSSKIGQKIVYAKIDRSAKSRELKEAFELLETAGVIFRVKRTSGAGLPLKTSARENFFKTIFLDVGLMHAMNGIYSETIKEKDLNVIFKGAVAEQFVGQELMALHNDYTKPELFYWAREAKNSMAEIDYLIEKNEKIIPLEIKSGSSGHLRSMKIFFETYGINKGVKISQSRYNDNTTITSIPFYSIESFLINC